MILDEDGRPLIPVHTCYSDAEAELVISFLEAYGVAAQANSDVPHSVLPLTVGQLGKVRVLVREDDMEEARNLLAETQRAPIPQEKDEAAPT